MAYGFLNGTAVAFAQITQNVGDGVNYYNVGSALLNFALRCGASFSSNVSIPSNAGTFGSMECNTNTGDVTSESSVSLNFLATTASELMSCILAQARAFQGDNYCNESDSNNQGLLIGLEVTGGIVGCLAVMGICSCLLKRSRAICTKNSFFQHSSQPYETLPSDNKIGQINQRSF